ncbi:type II toxin-antitoxin system mRNA interferase toxin, RelE/StbE family [Laspinema sp. D5]|nr:type II toxin-antitoxin system mRNA interferase toxin, RelE/StbE family [Laspinema sp. D3d]
MKSLIKKSPLLKPRIEERLNLLQSEPFNPLLRTHKLKGELAGAWSCSVEYDCRIVFNFIRNESTGEEEILLIDIGSHNEVY